MPPASHIPTVDFYGEQSESLTLDMLHCEPLIVRSRAHQFTIKPHRHPGITQLFYLNAGHGKARIDTRELTLRAPSLVIIPEMCVHAFDWSEEVSGLVVSINNAMLHKIAETQRQEQLKTIQAIILELDRDRDELDHLMHLLQHEYCQTPDRHRIHGLLSLVQLLSTWVERHIPDDTLREKSIDRRSDYLSRYKSLINSDFRNKRQVEIYARELGITAPHLNGVCKQLTGRTAIQLLHERTLLEAKRHLLYTAQSVSQVAYELGFSDPAYFSRFFRKLAGMTPGQFRSRGNPRDRSQATGI